MDDAMLVKIMFGLFGFCVTILSYFARQALKDIKKLESDKVSTVEFKEYIALNNNILLTQIAAMQDDIKYIRKRVDKATL